MLQDHLPSGTTIPGDQLSRQQSQVLGRKTKSVSTKGGHVLRTRICVPRPLYPVSA